MRRTALIAWGSWGVDLLVVGAALVLILLGYGDPGDRLDDLAWVVVLLAFVTVGAVVASRIPQNPVGWIFLSAALVGGIGIFTDLYFRLALVAGLPGVVLAAWVGQVVWLPLFVLLVALPVLLFPDGRPPSPRWRWVVWVSLAAGTIVGLFGAVVPGGLVALPEVPNPLGVEALDPEETLLGSVILGVGLGLALLSFLGAAASMVIRFRRSQGVERQQLKWFVYAAAWAGLAMASLIVMMVLSNTGDPPMGGWVEAAGTVITFLGVLALPVAATLAILRYRLYDIDLVINKTVVFALLAGFIGVTYSLIVVGLGRLIGGAEGLALPIAATAVVAVAFEPVRHRAQRWANRVVYGNRSTPYEVLSELTDRLARAEAGEGLLARMAALLRDGTGADRVTVWVGPPGEMSPGVSSPRDAPSTDDVDLQTDHVFPVVHNDDLVGALEVVKPRGSILSTNERSLVSDLAGSAGLVIGYQRLNDTLAHRARELEESRLRLVEAQDRERRRLERDLHDGAQQLIVALRVKLGLVSRMAASHGGELESLLTKLGEETELALAEIRSLAKGIYPPVLASDGLVAAVAGLAAGAPIEVIVSEDGIGRYPADIEAAIYFNISEAVTNAVKHGHPPIRVDLSEPDDVLRFTVTDSGPGFDAAVADGGSGLENMEDRLDAVGGRLVITSAMGVGTTVSGEIPLSPVPA